jgi:hypothetical protein
MVLPGFNTDFKYKGQVYHAQTEDNGVDNPIIVTLLYLSGAILASKKTPYQHLIGENDFRNRLMDLMKSQHRDIMKAVLAGEFEGAEKEAVEPAAEAVPAAAADSPMAAEAQAAAAAKTAGPEAAPPQEVPASKEPMSLDEAILKFLANFESDRMPEA